MENLIQMYKVLNNLIKIQEALVKDHFPFKLRNYFSHLIAVIHELFTDYWNKLPNSVVKSPSLDIFKACLDSFQESDCYSSSEHR